MTMTVHQLTVAVGAEISGIDLAVPLDDATFAAIERAFLDHGVLVFRDQAITAGQHVEFTRHFGEPDIHVIEQFNLPGHPNIWVLSNAKDETGAPLGVEDVGRFWHTDLAHTENPGAASFLYAIEVPPEGGDTLFAGMYAAYDALPTDLRTRIGSLNAVHGLYNPPELTDAQAAKFKPHVHPLVRTHPQTGRKAIYAGGNALGVEGLSEDEARALLDRLAEFCAQERFVYRHRWRRGDLVLWDNRCVLHRATDFDPRHRRHMHRTTVAGDRPV